MLKFAGLIALTAASTALGLLFASAKGNRVRELASLALLIGELETRIRFERAELCVLFRRAAEKQDYACLPFLPLCSENMARMDFAGAFSSAVSECRAQMHLSEDDWKQVFSFAGALGATDLEGQLANCRVHEALFSEQLEAAKKDYAEKHKLYVSLGLFSGLMISVLLI